MTFKTMTLTAVVALSSAAAVAEEVRVYNWSDYIDEALLEKFEAETGITPNTNDMQKTIRNRIRDIHMSLKSWTSHTSIIWSYQIRPQT